MTISKQQFTPEILAHIQALIDANPGWSRCTLSVQVCEWLEWRSPNGKLKEMSCRVALLKLERAGLLHLPPKRRRPAQGMAPFQQEPAIQCSLSELGDITLVLVKGSNTKTSRQWNELMNRHHYLGSGPLCGAPLRYLIHSYRYGDVGGFAFSAAAWRLEPRERWIGWDDHARREHLNRVINNSRFFDFFIAVLCSCSYLHGQWKTAAQREFEIIEMHEPKVNLDLALQHGLSEDEFNRILKILGRTPTFTELGIFSVMWSEHCSYKNSIAQIKTLPREGKDLLVKAGEENAGLIDIGDGLAIAFKMESHNHPSAVEPYQGAATGVGGILRDIFTMGARPIAALNSLRFGDLSDPRVRYLVRGVVKGIGDYGNCFGVPTVAGEVYFDDCYRDNPLVNAMAVGIVKHDGIVHAVAKGDGNAVILIGSSTGRDGIHGATFASEEISEKSEAKRPQVQVGDPFTEKLLLEASLEMIKQDLIVGMQDMGAAGITCSTSEMAARGESGMDVDLDNVPLREKGMTPYEIMLSESQERMLVVAKPGKEKAIQEICKKWDLHAAVIGQVAEGEGRGVKSEERQATSDERPATDGLLRVRMNGQIVAEIPAKELVLGGGAPVYVREQKEPEYLKAVRDFDPQSLPQPKDLNEVFLKMLASPNIASKQWVHEQYDSTVRSNTVIMPGGDAAVLRIKGTNKGIALKADCNGRYVYLNPKRGAAIAVAEAARNVAVSGGRPVGITNCLNFGNPYKPEVYWQFAQAVAGIGEACRVLETPVTGGNVSFYNESPDRAVYPTPTIGMLGVLDDISHATTPWFKNEGDEIALIGTNLEEVGGSEYLKVIHDKVAGDCPQLDLQFEKNIQAACLQMIRWKLLSSAHDVSDGGLAIALAECCIMNQEKMFGANCTLSNFVRADFALFGESQSMIVISFAPKFRSRIEEVCVMRAVPFVQLGRVEGRALRIAEHIEITCERMAVDYDAAIPRWMER